MQALCAESVSRRQAGNKLAQSGTRPEAGVRRFLERILDRSRSAEFLNSLETLARRLSLLGALNSLRTSLKAMLSAYRTSIRAPSSGIFPSSIPTIAVLWILLHAHPRLRRWKSRIGHSLRRVARRSAEARLDPAPAAASQRTTRRVHAGQLSAAGGERAAPRSHHRLARQWERNAVIVVVAKSFAPFTEIGRVWPNADALSTARSPSRAMPPMPARTSFGSPRRFGICPLRSSRRKSLPLQGQHESASALRLKRDASRQFRFVSSRRPRSRIMVCATSAKRCSSQGNVTSTFT